MDAKVGDWVVTPRIGCPVEIQALWYNALKSMEEWARQLGNADTQGRYASMSSRLRDTFHAEFWNESSQCLYDVVDGDDRDSSVRPNQVFAISLHHSMLADDRSRSILDIVERELLTPYGLRTLSPRDPDYRGRFEGDMRSRDSAYHQGTVWPWLLGPFISASMKVYGNDLAMRAKITGWIEPLRRHLMEAGLGQISEVFDGDFPHHPGGCFAQAWSVAEVLRALMDLQSGVPSSPAKERQK
jgi:glycogen debranching enzyme